MAVIASGSIRLNNQQGLSVGVTLENGETAVQTRFIAKDDAYGLYRVSDGALLQGAKLMPDGSVVGVSSAIIDPESGGASYAHITASPDIEGDVPDGAYMALRLMGISYNGATDPDPSNPTYAPEQTGNVAGLTIYTINFPEWDEVSNTYSDNVFSSVSSAGDLDIYGSNMIVGAVVHDDEFGGEVVVAQVMLSETGAATIEGDGGSMSISKSIHPNGAADFSCHVIPSENDAYALGSTAYSKRWRRLYCVQAPDVSSDARLKKNIEDLDGSLIYRLRPRKFRMRDGDGKLRFGLIAQEVKAALDELGIEGADLYGDENPDSLSLVYEELIAPLIAAVQEQKSRIDDLESRLSALEAKIG